MLYAHGLCINFRSISTREKPNPMTHASKLMHIRRNVSGSSRRMKYEPSGIPITTLGISTNKIFSLSEINRPS